MARSASAPSGSACARASSTTKSLPSPFILRKADEVVCSMDPFSRDGATLEKASDPLTSSSSRFSGRLPARRKATKARTAKPAPAAKVAPAPILSQRSPASTLAPKAATPVMRPNTPKAVPRKCSGAVAAIERREHALGEAHMQPPQANAEKDADERLSRNRARDLPRSGRRGRGSGAGARRSCPAGARLDRRSREDEAHHGDHRRCPGDARPTCLRADDEKCLAEACRA